VVPSDGDGDGDGEGCPGSGRPGTVGWLGMPGIDALADGDGLGVGDGDEWQGMMIGMHHSVGRAPEVSAAAAGRAAAPTALGASARSAAASSAERARRVVIA